MSFRLFIYYCALCGGAAALVGWMLGRWLAPHEVLAESAVKGLVVGALVAFGLGLVDALWELTLARWPLVVVRVAAAVLIGALGGLAGGALGQALYGWTERPAFLVLGWAFTGLLVGLSLGAFEVLSRLARREDWRGARRKVMNGLLGGVLGGILGGLLSVYLRGAWADAFRSKNVEGLWSPSATGFTALGLCIGLLIGLARVILKEAWVRVESGFRPGREMILSRPETTIGRAESSDIGLFGDAGVARTHARIVRQQDSYLLVDAGTPAGTFVNDERVVGPRPLHAGDRIRVGSSVLRFGGRARDKPGDRS